MKNKNKTVWSKRLKGSPSKLFERIGASVHIDKRLYKQDIFASKVHTQMLIKQKIIPIKDGNKDIQNDSNEYENLFLRLNNIENIMTEIKEYLQKDN